MNKLQKNWVWTGIWSVCTIIVLWSIVCILAIIRHHSEIIRSCSPTVIVLLIILIFAWSMAYRGLNGRTTRTQ